MDTTTVLAIIEMIDRSINYKTKHLSIDTEYLHYNAIGQEMALIELRDHLQQCIEGQLNAAENTTVE
jgi:hypothetical protein